MQIFVYEFITGGGWFFIDGPAPPRGSLLREGAAMLTAAAEDFAGLAEMEVCTLWDARLPPPNGRRFEIRAVDSPAAHDEQFRQAACRADYTLAIAPEFDGRLRHACESVVAAGGRLLGPDPAFVALAADKHLTAARLASAGAAVPQGIALAAGEPLPDDFPYPAVLKPRDGAGSQGVRLVADIGEARRLRPVASPSRLEVHHAGDAASITVLCGPAGNRPLPPCRQFLSRDGRFAYLGGECPLPPPLAVRACRLAEQALAALPPTTGYVGVDMVLGEDPRGAGDVIIEVNPRLTTSYVGLRSMVRENLAGAMLQAAEGEVPDLSLRQSGVRFTADGQVTVV